MRERDTRRSSLCRSSRGWSSSQTKNVPIFAISIAISITIPIAIAFAFEMHRAFFSVFWILTCASLFSSSNISTLIQLLIAVVKLLQMKQAQLGPEGKGPRVVFEKPKTELIIENFQVWILIPISLKLYPIPIHSKQN